MDERRPRHGSSAILMYVNWAVSLAGRVASDVSAEPARRLTRRPVKKRPREAGTHKAHGSGTVQAAVSLPV